MKKITLLALMLLFTFKFFGQAGNYNVGDVVDDFTVTDVYGVEHNLYEYADAGKYIYLDFFFDTCGPCQTWQFFGCRRQAPLFLHFDTQRPV